MKKVERWTFVLTRLISSAGQAVMLVVLARTASVEELGAVTALTGVAIFAISILDLGVTTALLQFAASGQRRLATSALRLSLLLTPLLPLATAAVMLLLRLPVDALTLICLCVWPAAEKLIEVALSLRIGHGRLNSASALTVARRVLPMAIQPALLLLGTDGTLAYSGALMTGATVVLGTQTRLFAEHWGPRTHSVGFILKSAWPMYLAASASQSRELEVPIVAALASPLAASGYALGFRFSRPIAMIGSSLAQVALADASRMGVAAIRPILRRSILIGGMGVAIAVATGPLLGEILATIVGDQYAQFGRMASLLVAAAIVASATMPLSAVLQGLGMARLVAAMAIWSSVSGLLAVLVTTAVASGTAAAIAVCLVGTLRFAATSILAARLADPSV